MLSLLLACTGEPSCTLPERDGATYVVAGSEDGIGSIDRPLAKLEQAPSGAFVVLGEGDWPMADTVFRRIEGACPGVVITGDLRATESIDLENLTVRGTLHVEGASTEVSCTDCAFEESLAYPLFANLGAYLELERVTVTDVRRVDGHATGLRVAGGARVYATDLVIDGADDGVVLVDGAEGTFDGLTIRNLDAEGLESVGLYIVDSQATGTRVTIEHVRGPGALIAQGEVTLQDVGVSDTWGLIAPAFGVGEGGVLHLTDALVEQGTGADIAVLYGGEAHLDGVEVGSVRSWQGPDDEHPAQIGVVVGAGGLVTATDVRFTGDEGEAVAAFGRFFLEGGELGPSSGTGVFAAKGATVLIRDVDIVGRTAIGVAADGASLLAERVTVSGTRRPEVVKLGAGIAALNGGSVHLIDVEIRDTQGFGLISEGAEMSCVGCLIEDSRLAAVLVSNGSVGVFEGLTIDGVTREGSSRLAMGLFVGSNNGLGAEVTASGVTITDAGYAGVWVEGGTLALSDFSVSGGPRVELLEDVWSYGHGVYGRDAVLDLRNGLIYDADGAGVFLHHSPAVVVADVVFSDNTVDVWQQACEQPIEVEDDWAEVTCPMYDEPVLPMDYYGIVI